MATVPRPGAVALEHGELTYFVADGGSAGHVVWFLEVNQHLDMAWTDPTISGEISALARDGLTSVLFQARGVGPSDRVTHWPTVEEQAADLLAVLDAEGIEDAVLVGTFTTGWPAALVAAQHPDRVRGLLLLNTPAAGALAGDADCGWTPEGSRTGAELYRRVAAGWGAGMSLEVWDPGLCTAFNRRLISVAERCSAGRGYATQSIERGLATDGRPFLREVRVPTRILRVPNNTLPEAAVRATAGLVRGATYHELPATALGDSIGAAWKPVVRHAAELARGAGARTGERDRVLATVLFTDIVGSTERLAALGDAEWSATLDRHERTLRREVTQAGGRVVTTSGDGILAEFAGPAAAVRCAQALCAGAPDLGVRLRAGVHAGECDRRGDDLAGIAVHIGARVCALAGPGDDLVSRTVRDLVAGSGLGLEPHGTHDLRGVPGTWEVFRAVTAPPPPIPAAAPVDRSVDRATVALARRSPRAVRAATRLGYALQRARYGRAAA